MGDNTTDTYISRNKRIGNILSILGAIIALAALILMLVANNNATKKIQQLEKANKELIEKMK